MRFTVRGVWQGRPVDVTWEDGRLEGPEEVVVLLQYHAELRREGLGPALVAGPDGPRYDEAGLSNPMVAVLLMQQLLDEIRAIEGEEGEPSLEIRARNVFRGGRRRRPKPSPEA